MSKHTPGPWVIKRDEYVDGAIHLIRASGDVAIASVRDNEADALLIAAAPEMRDVIHALLLFYHGGLDWNDDTRREWKRLTGNNDATTRVLADFARRVLAKTEDFA